MFRRADIHGMAFQLCQPISAIGLHALQITVSETYTALNVKHKRGVKVCERGSPLG